MSSTPQELTKATSNQEIAAPQQETAMLQMIERAATMPDANVENMERLWAMYREMRADDAKAKYAQAMADVQAELPAIEKRARNLQTKSNYAKLEMICEKLTPIATSHGFSLSFGTGKAENDGEVRTVCRVSHSAGHSEDFHVDLPPDNAGIQGTTNKTAVHARKSSLTYGRTTLTCMIFNVSTVEVDDDGNGAGKPMKFITEDQALTLKDLADEVSADKEKFFAYMGAQCNRHIESFGEIPETAHKLAISALEAKRKAPEATA